MLARLGGFPVFIIALAIAAGALAQSDAPRTMTAKRINPHPPTIDGQLNDIIWQNAQFSGDFIQKEPNEGEPAANQSEIAVVYDGEAIYVAARLQCVDPDNIVSTVSRRDNHGNSERIIVSFDSYQDNRTAYTFSVTASGTRSDWYHPSDAEGSRDYDFDPVWKAKTVRTTDGWSAEMRIPFSQLRFRSGDTQVWGINVNRWVPNTNEDSYWIVVPKDEQGWASRMGDLVGIEAIEPSRRIELTPYVANDFTHTNNVDPDDPFNDGTDYSARFGGDFKMGVGPNLTLEGTINPDFGQVEADPAEVNLSAFETFFDERRPFFTEGSNLLQGGGAAFFYSRRIGAQPHGDAGGDFQDTPDNTSILGAAKLTGRLNSGLSVGVLAALTEKEEADAFSLDTGRETRKGVEPRSGFGVLRLQQEFGRNQSTAGVILTGVGRDMSVGNDLDKQLAEKAFAGAGDWNLRFMGGDYSFWGGAGFSNIRGTPEAIESQQRSSRRYYQRPDAGHVGVDTTRTSLTGWEMETGVEKNAGRWLWNVGANVESPGFEINDIGQLGTADDVDYWAGARYRQTDPGDHLQSWWVGTWYGLGHNFDGDRQYSFVDYESQVVFRNFYGMWWGGEYYPAAQSDNLTRGGPSMATPDEWNVSWNLWSNNKGRTNWWLWTRYAADDIDGWSYSAEGGFTYRPGSRWQISVNPRWNQTVNTRQYFDTIDGGGRDETYGNRYVFASIERSRVVMQTRLNYAFTPDLTLEFYAEPFAASGRYFDHGELLRPRDNELITYGQDGTSITYNRDTGEYQVVDGAETFSLANRDFNYFSFRSNLVLRWEWSPGSTLYLVWQQNRADDEGIGSLVGPRNFLDALSAQGDNFVALKVTYWIPFL